MNRIVPFWDAMIAAGWRFWFKTFTVVGLIWLIAWLNTRGM